MTEYSLNGKIEQLQQEVAELRDKHEKQQKLIMSQHEFWFKHFYLLSSAIDDLIERPTAVAYTPGQYRRARGIAPPAEPEAVDDDDSGAIVGGGPGYKAMIEAEMDNNCDCEDDNADGVPAQPAPAEGIDVERVMALVKQYGEELSDMSFFKETDPEKLGYFDYHEEIAEKLFAEIRAMLGGAR